MDVATITIICLVIAVVLLVLKMPIAFMFLLVGIISLTLVKGLDTALMALASRPYAINAQYHLSVIPLFVLMGHLTFAAGIGPDLFLATRNWVGHIRGGLVIATTIANAVFGAACGSTTAAVAVFGRMAMPEMLRYNVSRKLASGCISAAACLSAIIPPSVMIVIFGILAEKSIAFLLIAGIIPGIVTTIIYTAGVWLMATVKPNLAPPAPAVSWGERARTTKGVWGVLVLALLVLGGMYTGLFTPTEAGSIGAMGAFIIVIARRKLTVTVLRESFLDTARTTGIIFLLLTGAIFFATFLSLTGVSAQISSFLVSLPLPPVVIVILTMFLFLALGCILDPISTMFLTLPFLLEPLKAMGVDLFWYGILVVKVTAIGMVTPPVGLNCFMLKSVVPELKLNEIFTGSAWFLAMEGVALAVIITFPQITLWLPSQMF